MSFANIKIDPLGRENYDTWKIQILALLIKNDVWKYVSGQSSGPTDSQEKALEWDINVQ